MRANLIPQLDFHCVSDRVLVSLRSDIAHLQSGSSINVLPITEGKVIDEDEDDLDYGEPISQPETEELEEEEKKPVVKKKKLPVEVKVPVLDNEDEEEGEVKKKKLPAKKKGEKKK